MKPSVAKSASDASKGSGPASVSSERGGTVARGLDAAEAVFAESGFAGASVRDIASRAGLNAASLYNYYPGKQELYEAVMIIPGAWFIRPDGTVHLKHTGPATKEWFEDQVKAMLGAPAPEAP